MAEFDTNYTDEIICPWCGTEFEASYEFFEGSTECRVVKCDECGKSFDATRHISVDYSTSKVTVPELRRRAIDEEERRRKAIADLDTWRAAHKEADRG